MKRNGLKRFNNICIYPALIKNSHLINVYGTFIMGKLKQNISVVVIRPSFSSGTPVSSTNKIDAMI